MEDDGPRGTRQTLTPGDRPSAPGVSPTTCGPCSNAPAKQANGSPSALEMRRALSWRKMALSSPEDLAHHDLKPKWFMCTLR